MRAIAYSSPFVPVEWIAAHGLAPVRLSPRAGNSLGGEGRCPFMQAYVEQVAARDDIAAIFTTTCDQMRRAAELAASRPVFLMNVPATWQGQAPGAMYRAELQRLGKFLESHGGTSPSLGRLAAVMLRYDGIRSRLKATAGRVDPLRFHELTMALASCSLEGLPVLERAIDNEAASASSSGEPPSRRIPLAVVGGALTNNDAQVLGLLGRLGGSVVLDATEAGERGMPDAFADFGASPVADPLAELVRAYFDSIGDAFRRPDVRLHDWLTQQVAARGVRGVVLLRQLWCDLWHAQLDVIRQHSRVPVLDIELAGEAAIPAALETRLAAFLEMLQ